MQENADPVPDAVAPVHITGVPTEITDHPAMRKIARSVLSIAARQLEVEEETKNAPSLPEVDHD